MGTFAIDAEFAGLRTPNRFVTVPRMLVGSGSEYTWIPEGLLRAAGIRPEKDLEFLMDGQVVTRSIGFAHLRAGGFFTVDEVVFALESDAARLGARTLTGFGARVDARLERLVVSGPQPAAVSLAG